MKRERFDRGNDAVASDQLEGNVNRLELKCVPVFLRHPMLSFESRLVFRFCHYDI
jgi:hypothetical protein